MNSQTSNRFYYLDGLRAFLMYLGIILHSVLPFNHFKLSSWPVSNSTATFWADVLTYSIHSFRMQTFFLIAGFFAYLSQKKMGKTAFLKNRFKRVIVPFILTLFTIQIGIKFLILNHQSDVSLAHFISSLEFLKSLQPLNLWFLYYLFFITLLFTFLPFELPDRFYNLPTMIFITLLLLIPMETWTADTSPEWQISIKLFCYYSFFFLTGKKWAASIDRNIWTINWKKTFLLANLVCLPACGLLSLWLIPLRDKGLEFSGFKILWLITLFFQASYTILMIHALIVAFQALLNKKSAAIRYLAESSYFAYLASLLPIIYLQFIICEWNLFPSAKYLLIVTGSIIILLICYELCVRKTFIGKILGIRNE